MAWDAAEGIVDLNTKISSGDAASWSLVFATGVNTGGMVVGAMVNNELQITDGFLLRP